MDRLVERWPCPSGVGVPSSIAPRAASSLHPAERESMPISMPSGHLGEEGLRGDRRRVAEPVDPHRSLLVRPLGVAGLEQPGPVPIGSSSAWRTTTARQGWRFPGQGAMRAASSTRCTFSGSTPCQGRNHRMLRRLPTAFRNSIDSPVHRRDRRNRFRGASIHHRRHTGITGPRRRHPRAAARRRARGSRRPARRPARGGAGCGRRGTGAARGRALRRPRARA